MEKNKEKQFDAFLKKSIKEVELDAPSINFTDDLLKKLEVKQVEKTALVYKPLISKTNWIIICLLMLIVLLVTHMSDFEPTLGWWPSTNMDVSYVFGELPKIVISNTYLYGFVGLAFFLLLQIYFIRSHINKQYITN